MLDVLEDLGIGIALRPGGGQHGGQALHIPEDCAEALHIVAKGGVKFLARSCEAVLGDVGQYPWAVVYRDMLAENAGMIFGSMVSFLGILLVGYVYALKKQAFDWKSST